MNPALDGFRAAIVDAGLTPPVEVIADGKLRRFSSNGTPGDDAAWYVAHADGIPAGAFGDWRAGIEGKWRAPLDRQLSPAEAHALKERETAMRRLREVEQARERAEAAGKAKALWKRAQPVGEDYPYLARKGVSPVAALREIQAGTASEILGYPPKARGEPLSGRLLVAPIKVAGDWSSAELIDESGRKSAIAGGAKAGGYWATGVLPDGDGLGLTLHIAEGVATALSIAQAVGEVALAALSCGNLERVARAMRERYPQARIIVCGDLGNGQQAAVEAARAIGGLLALPDFGENRPSDASDFNDLVRHAGAEAAKRALENASAPDVQSPQATTPSAAAGNLSSRSSAAIVRRLSDIAAKPIRWLWPGRVARGKVSMIAGHPGLGKSQVTAALAAVVTTGGKWPVDRTDCERGDVILLNAEDDAADTIRPRLEAAGADVARIEIIEAVTDGFRADGEQQVRGFNLKADLGVLDSLLASRPGVALVVIDPVSAYLSGVDTHVNADVRAILAPLGELAARHGVAIVCVSHLNKGSANKATAGEAMLRVSGSLAFVAAARAAYIVTQDQDNPARRLFLPAKNNVGKEQAGLAFTVESYQLSNTIETSRVLWEPHSVTITADEAMAAPMQDDDRTMTDEALDLLREILIAGRVLAKDVKRHAIDAGISDKALRNARARLGIVVDREGFGAQTKTFWRLRPVPLVPSVPINASLENRAQMDSEGMNGGVGGSNATNSERF